MRRVFAHTDYWVALLNPQDELHQKVGELSNQIDSLDKVNSKRGIQ